ncbi:MAG: polysulfide reductase [Desulfobulbaceae bacterium]|nr:MAG: polysulfide reductase [Desulfobulbaceae bacterium]
MNFLTINGKMINSRGDRIWVITTGLFCLIGLIGLTNFLIQGHDAYNVHRQVPWGLLISTYIFFGLSSTGLCLVASLSRVFGLEPFEVIGKRVIVMAIITLVAAFVVIGLELGQPLRMIYNIISPNLAAPLWWMGTLYGLYLTAIVVAFILMTKGLHRYVGYAILVGFVSGIVKHSTLGSVFGLLDARLWWQGPFIPISTIVAAAAGGCAIVILLLAHRYYREKMPRDVDQAVRTTGRIFTILLGILLFAEFWKVMTTIYGGIPGKHDAMMILLNGPMALHYWFFAVFLGLLLPFILLLATGGKRLEISVVAAISSLIGLFFMRYNMVVVGQLVPLRPDVDRAHPITGLVSYNPSATEFAIVIGGFGLCLALYFVASRVFNLDAEAARH